MIFMPNIYNKEGISFNNIIKPYNKLGFEGPFHPFINNAESDMTLSEYLSTNRSTANTGEYFTTNAIDIHWGGAVLPNFNGGSRTINTTSQLLEAIQAASNTGGSSYNHPSYTAYNSGLYKITVNSQGHITSATAVTVNDLRALLDDVYEPKTINKVTPTLTVNNPASTTIADGGTTTIAITSSVPGILRFSSNDSIAAGSDGTAWKANITPTSTAATSFTITITNNTAVTEASSITTNGIKVTFTPSDTNNYNVVSDVNVVKQTITLSAGTVTNTYYWYVGTTKPASLSEATTIQSYPNEQTYTNNSGAKSHIFVLTNDDKNVTFINPELNSPVSQVAVDTTTIPGYNIFETAVGTANGTSIKIQIS